MRSLQFSARGAGGAGTDRPAVAIRSTAELVRDARAMRTRTLQIWRRAMRRALRRLSRRIAGALRLRPATVRATTHSVPLACEQLLVFKNAQHTRIKVVFGDVWLTCDDDNIDYLASSGQEITLAGKGRAVLAALAATRLEITSANHRWGHRWGQVLLFAGAVREQKARPDPMNALNPYLNP